MRLIKYTHACVRIEDEGRVLLLDPGVWAENEAFTGASAVLVTHEHFDHIDTDRLTAAQQADPDLKIYTNADVAGQLADLGDAVVAVAPGEEFTAAGFGVRAVGGEHAEIYEGLPGCANIGFVIADRVYHPGDSLFVPDGEVDPLPVPISAPWLKLGEALDFVRAVKPRRAHPIHDAMYSQVGQELTDRWFNLKGNTDYSRLPLGEPVAV